MRRVLFFVTLASSTNAHGLARLFLKLSHPNTQCFSTLTNVLVPTARTCKIISREPPDVSREIALFSIASRVTVRQTSLVLPHGGQLPIPRCTLRVASRSIQYHLFLLLTFPLLREVEENTMRFWKRDITGKLKETGVLYFGESKRRGDAWVPHGYGTIFLYCLVHVKPHATSFIRDYLQ